VHSFDGIVAFTTEFRKDGHIRLLLLSYAQRPEDVRKCSGSHRAAVDKLRDAAAVSV
jgi:hypothetical protein